MNILLWVLQILLAALFGLGGFMKATAPISDVVAKVGWASAVSPGLVRFIGVSELAGGLGLLLPALTRIAPRLTPLAASGLALIMLLAMGFHASRNEISVLPFNLAFGAAAAFVAWGRWKKVPIAPRA